MILNPNKTKTLMVSRSRTVNPPHGDLVFSGVSIRASPNLDILGRKFDSRFTFEDHVRGIVFRVSQRLGNFEVSAQLCCFVAILHLFSQSLGIVLRCGGQLLNDIFSFSSGTCIRWPGFALIRRSYRRVIDVMLLRCVCC